MWPNLISIINQFCHGISLSYFPTSSLWLLAVPNHDGFDPLCCREHFFMWHVEEMLRLSSIFWRKGQTPLLKIMMVKPHSHGQFIQGTSKIKNGNLFQCSNSIITWVQFWVREARTHELWPKDPESWGLCCLAAMTELQLSTKNLCAGTKLGFS